MSARRDLPIVGKSILLIEALACLTAGVLAVRLLPFRLSVRSGSRRMGRRGDMPDEAKIAQVRWAVLAWARRVPWRSVCFDRGLALQWMLRRRGVAARLHYGIGHKESGDLAAHVWIEADQSIVLGAEEAPNFRPVAVYP